CAHGRHLRGGRPARHSSVQGRRGLRRRRRQRPGRRVSGHPRHRGAGEGKGRGLHPSRLRIFVGECGVRAGVRGGGNYFRGPARRTVEKHGRQAHLAERDCSVQRRHQKVIEIAPSVDIEKRVRAELCEAAVRLCHEIKYDNAGTVEFLYDLDTNEWFFIEMNPRIQVEHTVTEVITGLDLVRSQILIADGKPMHSPEVGIPAQEDMPRNGYAVQCRITTEDPENKFQPDYGRILTYRSAGGFGVRLDGGMGYGGAVITPFYDSLLVKLTVSAQTFDSALQRMDRALREFRIRGVKTNIPFLENVIHNETFKKGLATTTLIDTTPELFNFKPRRDRATKLLKYLGDI